MIVAWINQTTGKANFTDRHIRGRSVLVDETQKWFPLLVTSTDGFLVAKFTRKIDICDQSGEHIDIPTGTPSVIFAYGTNFVNGDITYHDFRGTQSLPLISALNSNVDIDMSQIETVDYRVNVNINIDKTTFLLRIFLF